MKGKRVHDCPFCENGSLMAKDSRPSPLENVLRRRTKECDTCGERVTTHEVIINDSRAGDSVTEFQTILFLRDINKAYAERFGHTKAMHVLAGMGTKR